MAGAQAAPGSPVSGPPLNGQGQAGFEGPFAQPEDPGSGWDLRRFPAGTSLAAILAAERDLRVVHSVYRYVPAEPSGEPGSGRWDAACLGNGAD